MQIPCQYQHFAFAAIETSLKEIRGLFLTKIGYQVVYAEMRGHWVGPRYVPDYSVLTSQEYLFIACIVVFSPEKTP